MRTTTRFLSMAGVALATVLLAALAVRRGDAHVGLEGDAPFTFFAGWLERPNGAAPGRFVVVWNGLFPDTASGWARLRLPPGVHLVSGDTIITGRPHGEGLRWVVGIRCDDAAPSYIRGAMWVDDHSRRVDESEFDLKCSNVPDSLPADYSLERRAECVIAGQRFRYAGMFRVPIDGPEYVVEEEIERSGAHPVAEFMPEIMDQHLATAVDTVTCIIFVRPSGGVREVRIMPTMGIDDRTSTLVRDGVLSQWRFRPARIKNTAYDDWLMIRVPLRRP
jgi:hypothetical protein